MEEYEYTARGRRLTKHAMRRLEERQVDVDAVIDNFSHRFVQDDGAQVYAKRQNTNRYDVVVLDDQGVVTVLTGVKKHELRNLARNYGWR